LSGKVDREAWKEKASTKEENAVERGEGIVNTGRERHLSISTPKGRTGGRSRQGKSYREERIWM